MNCHNSNYDLCIKGSVPFNHLLRFRNLGEAICIVQFHRYGDSDDEDHICDHNDDDGDGGDDGECLKE